MLGGGAGRLRGGARCGRPIRHWALGSLEMWGRDKGAFGNDEGPMSSQRGSERQGAFGNDEGKPWVL